MELPGLVMFIDDDPEDQEFFCEAVSVVDASIRRSTANNGLEALRMLSEPDAIIPDFIFLDINMPFLNGKECFVELRKIEKLKHIPIIMCSTSKFSSDQDDCKKLGADFFLVKPNTLIDMVNSLLFVFATYSAKATEVHRATH